MLPYVPQPVIAGVTAFEICLGLGTVTGFLIFDKRATRLGWSSRDALSLVLWIMLVGFVSSHVLDALLYYPEAVRQNPWLLLQVWGSMSSFGGLAGGMATALFLCWKRKLGAFKSLQLFDLMAYGFPFAWIFGRLGCALAHDHLGVYSQSFWAVDFPGGARFDLGLLEWFATLIIAALWLWLDRRPRANGFYLALFFALYGPVRFSLDVLRTDDQRYLGWTPGQYASVAGTLAACAFLLRQAADSRKPAGAPTTNA